MEKESYSIDDILSEVKKRREENEQELKLAADTHEEDHSDEDMKIVESEGSEQSIEEPNEKEESTEEAFDIVEKGADQADAEFDIVEKTDEPAEETVIFQKADEPSAEAEPEQEAPEEEMGVVSDNQSSEPDENGMVDLLSLADETQLVQPEEEENEEKVKFSKTKKGKIIISIIVILVLLIAAGAGFGIWYANNALNKVTEQAEPYEKVSYYDGMDFLQEDFPTIDEVSASELYSYKEYLKQWYSNGDPVSSTHVMNVLLIGEDTRNEQISDTSRADSAIIASINIDTQEIHLTSILRDLYVYFEVDGQGYYEKINAAASLGGMKCYINTIERYYKIAIDNYAVVNFASFPKIIDSLGGVTIKITSAEINEINNHQARYGNVTIKQDFDGTEGKMKLNGKQALAYCRIRKIDSDGARANRQKTVLQAIFKKMKSGGAIDAVKTVNSLINYVYTGFEKSELIEIGNTALKDNWLDYEVKSTNLPTTENCKGGQKFSTAPNNWIWISDIPEDAYNLQMEIYGKSNINLNPNRADYIALGR